MALFFAIFVGLILIGDSDDDGDVDLSDILCSADLDFDGSIGAKEFALFLLWFTVVYMVVVVVFASLVIVMLFNFIDELTNICNTLPNCCCGCFGNIGQNIGQSTTTFLHQRSSIGSHLNAKNRLMKHVLPSS